MAEKKTAEKITSRSKAPALERTVFEALPHASGF